MKYIKTYEELDFLDIKRYFTNNSSIKNICKKYGIENYTINKYGSVDVDGDVDLHKDLLTSLPIKFRNVSGYFRCSENNLTNLEGCPVSVGGGFFCNDNYLSNLEGCPVSVGGIFNCSYNKLTSLKGCPNRVGGSFNCSVNKLTSLEGCPEYIGGDFSVRSNNIRDFYGFPDFWEGDLFIGMNPIYEIYVLFNRNNRCTELLNTTRTIVNGNSIRVEGILDVADAMNIELPEDWKDKIYCYKLID